MTTPRTQVPIDAATGKPLDYKARAAIRKTADHEKLIADRQRKQQEQQAAALLPPQPRPTFAERAQRRKAESEGRSEAADVAEAKAKAEAGPVNHWRVRADELRGKQYLGPKMERRYQDALAKADELDRMRAAETAAAEKRDAIFNAPANVRARAYVESMKKLSGPEWQEEIAMISGIVAEGQAELAWEKIRDVEARQWAAADAKAAAAHQTKSVSDAEFVKLANEAEAARERAATSAKMVQE